MQLLTVYIWKVLNSMRNGYDIKLMKTKDAKIQIWLQIWMKIKYMLYTFTHIEKYLKMEKH